MSSKIELQKDLEHLFDKNQLIPRIRQEFKNERVIMDHIKAVGLPQEFALDLLSQMALHKRASLPVLVGCLNRHAPSAQAVVGLIQKAAEADLVDYAGDLDLFIVKFLISDDVQSELDRFQYPLPMVVEPKELLCNKDNGYLTSRGSVILRNNHHEEDVCLDHINRVNKTGFRINMDTAKMIRNRWRHLDKPKEGESHEEFQDRRRAFEKYDRTANHMIEALSQMSDVIYLTHKYDKRGRIYCQGYHVTYQGATWNKAVLEFANGEVVE